MTFRALLPSPRKIPSTSRQSTPIHAEPQTPVWRRLTALSLAALLLPFAQLDLFAQQAPPANPAYDQQQQQDYPPPPPDYPQSQSSQQQDVPPPPPDYPQPQPNDQQQPYPQPQSSYPQPTQQPNYQQQAPPPNYAQPPAQQYAHPYDQQYAPQYPQQQAAPYPDQPYNQPPPNQPQPQGLAPDQLDQLVAPIALYPDTLVAQILAASTFPTQIAEADRWRQMQPYASPQDIAAGANAQPWDPSIKALTAFPQVLADMNQNLSWATELGNAYYNQPQDVFDAIQAMRQRAQAAGTLQSTPQETVTDDQGYIALAPANPQVVYVPSYDPWVVYGAPIAPWPGFSLFGAIGGFGLRFGPGIVTSAFLGMPWGWFGWGLSWLGHCLFFDHQGYYPLSRTLADWGLPHGGPRGYWGRAAYAHYYNHGYARGNYYGRSVGNNYGRNLAQNRSFGENRGFSENRGYDSRGFNNSRGFADNRGNYGRQQALNSTPAFNARPGYGNEARYGSSFDNRAQQTYRSPEAARPAQNFGQSYNRPGAGYGSSHGSTYNRSYGQSYTQPNSFGRGGYNNSFRQAQSSFRQSTPTYRGYSGNSSFGQSSRSFSGYSQHSSGFSGGSHAESTPHYSSHSYGGGSHFSGSHSGGGGHSSHSGGGGHHR